MNYSIRNTKRKYILDCRIWNTNLYSKLYNPERLFFKICRWRKKVWRCI